MKKNNLTRALSLFVLTALLASLFACAAPGETAGTEAETDTAVSEAETAFEYEYPALNMSGNDFKILNGECKSWGFISELDVQGLTSEPVNDAIYTRNRTVEDKFNTKLAVTEVNIEATASEVRLQTQSGDDEYQIALVSRGSVSSLMTGNAVLNLSTVASFDFDDPWWDGDMQACFDVGHLGDVRFAVCDISLTGLECTVCTFFNEEIARDLKLESFYDMVNNGTWTFDKMNEAAVAAANLNAESNWGYSRTGTSRYGIVSYTTFPDAMLYAGGENSVVLDENGTPVFSYNGERFFKVAEGIAAITAQKGVFNDFNSGDAYYEDIFRDGRALMTVAQVKTTMRLRSMEQNFGVLPTPKYDVEQPSYHSFTTGTQEVVCMPATVRDTETAGIITDALAYLSYADVMPMYYDIALTQKGMRNEASVEMMNLIRDTRVADVGVTFGWTSALRTNLESKLMAGVGNLASLIAKNEKKINSAIEKTMKMLENRE